MHDRARSGKLTADFFTQSYRISGCLDVRSRKLADQLDDRTSSFLYVEDVYVSNTQHPGDIVASHSEAVIRKDGIMAAVVGREEDGLSRKYAYGSYIGSHVQKAFLIIPSFQIRGYLRLPGKADLRAVLTSGDAFIPLIDGEMKLSARPEISFAGGIILVNRGQIEVLCKEEESSRG